jgi:hypothetical protein
LQSLLDRMTCTSEQHCRGYLDILGLYANTEVDGKDYKISNVVVSFVGPQYRYVLGAFTGKYGKPLLLPNKIYGERPQFYCRERNRRMACTPPGGIETVERRKSPGCNSYSVETI